MHIVDKNGLLSPSAFIPFCSFGEAQLGVKIDQFDYQVCDIFTPVVFNDHLCYEANLDKLRDDQKFLTQMKMGLILIIDFNEEKQFETFVGESKRNENETKLKFSDDSAASIHMDTIGNIPLQKQLENYHQISFNYRSCGASRRRSIQSKYFERN